MKELPRGNGNGIRMRETEKDWNWIDASLEPLTERIALRFRA